MEKPTITIIVPSYNVEPYISRCLKSIKDQSFSNFEVIVVDDGSTDNSSEIAEQFALKDSRFKVVRQENNGQGSARNRGINLAQGDYLSFVDSDDWIHKDYLIKMYECILNTDADIAVCNVERVWESGKRKKNNGIYRKAEVITDTVQYLPRASMSVGDKLFKKSLFDGLRFPEKMKYEDFALMPQILIRAKKIVTIEDVLYFYFWRDGSTTNQKKINRDILKAQRILEASELMEKCPEMLQVFFVKNVMGSLVWGILKENEPFDEVAEIMKEGLQKYPGLVDRNFAALMGKRKKQCGYYLLYGNYRKAQKYVLFYDRIETYAKKVKQFLKIV